MAEMIASLPNVIIPASPEPPVPANKPVNDSPVKRNDTDNNASTAVATDRAQSTPERIDTNASEQNTSSDSSTEPKGENFQDVLEKKISNQSGPDAETTPDKNSKTSENPAKSELSDTEQENLLLANIINIQTETLKPATKTGENQTDAKAATSDGSPAPAKNQLAQEIVELPAQASSKADPKVVALNSTKTKPSADAAPELAGEPKAVTAKSVLENHAAASEHTDKPAEKIAANVQKLAENEKPQPSSVVPDVKPDATADIIKGPKAATAQSVIENRAAASEHTDKPAEQIAANIQKITENTKPQNESQPLEGKDAANQLAKDTVVEKLSDVNLKADTGQDSSTGNETTAENKSTSGITPQAKNKLSAEEAVAESINQDISAAQSTNADQNATKLTSESIVSITAANNVQTASATSATQAQSSTGTVNAVESASGPVRQNPVEQVIDSINATSAGPNREISIQLNPLELGKVHIRFQLTNGEITGVIEVEKQETSDEIEKALPQIVAALNESGTQVKRIDVTTSDRDQQSTDQQKNETSEAFEEAAYHQFSQSQSNTGSGGSSPSQSVLNENDEASVTENQPQTADGRINFFM